MKEANLKSVKVMLSAADKGETGILLITDDQQQQQSYRLTSSVLHQVMAPLLQLTTQWQGRADLEIDKLLGPYHPIQANKIELKKGRNDRECIVHIHVGAVEWTFLLPVEDFFKVAGEFLKQVTPPLLH